MGFGPGTAGYSIVEGVQPRSREEAHSESSSTQEREAPGRAIRAPKVAGWRWTQLAKGTKLQIIDGAIALLADAGLSDGWTSHVEGDVTSHKGSADIGPRAE